MNKLFFVLLAFCFIASASALNNTNYTVSGTYTVGAGTQLIIVEAIGGGGGGGNVTPNGAAAGGTGGSYVRSFFTVTAGENYTVTIGAAGGAGGYGGNTTVNGTGGTALASGGVPGVTHTGDFNPGATLASSSGSSGTTIYKGGNASSCGGCASGGGGAAGANGTGRDSVSTTAGVGADAWPLMSGSLAGGNGGAGRNTNGAGNVGVAPGGGGGGAYNNAGSNPGGVGARGEVRITALSSSDILLNFAVRRADTNALVTGQTNFTLTSQTTLGAYNYSSTSGEFFSIVSIPADTYSMFISSTGFPTNGAVLSLPSYTLNTFYVDSLAQTVFYNVIDTLGNIVSNATVTFSRSINGTLVVFAQKVSDFSGLLAVNLNPNGITYYLTAIDPTGGHANFTGTSVPIAGSSYNILMQVVSGGGFNTTLNGTYTNITANYFNSTKVINVTYEVISIDGSLTWFALNTTYNGSVYSQNISGSPGGGIAYVNISGVNLTVQDDINVTFAFLRSGYGVLSYTLPFHFEDDATPTNQSILGGALSGANSPGTAWGKALLGTILLCLFCLGAWRMSGDPQIVAIVALAVIGVFGVPAVGLFNSTFALITVIVGVIILIGDAVVNR